MEPRNVVVSGSTHISIIDFELSNSQHMCSPQSCDELINIHRDLEMELEGNPPCHGV